MKRQKSRVESSRRVLKKELFRYSKDMYDSLNFVSLMPWLQDTRLKFLSSEEIVRLYEEPTDSSKANYLMVTLQRKGSRALQKFIACLCLEDDHRGHIILAQSIMMRLPPAVREKIEHHVELVLTDTPVSSTSSSPAPDVTQMCIISPDRPLPQTELVGDLASDEYLRLDRKLWTYFSTGGFKSLETIIREEGSIETSPSDWKIVTMWFQALVVMHRDHNYHMCISELLVPALQLCRETESINATILEGRIYQRMAQVYLVMDLPKYAQKHFEMAKEELQWVSRGYDKANMLCREAKLRSATSFTPEERNLTEKLFNDALECVPEEAPYALASRPSLILSKAAFHLHISFGSTTRNMEEPPCVSPEEAKKAKDTLSKLDEKDILLSMRKCERQLLSAELLRLDGNFDAALEAYASTVRQSEEASLKNLVSIAKCRMEYIRCKRRV